MARRSLTLALATRLASEVVKDDDSHIDSLVELFVKMVPKGDAQQRTIRTAILQEWYVQTEHFRAGFRNYMEQFEENDEGEADAESETIESSAIAS